jgi:hypothetical protein
LSGGPLEEPARFACTLDGFLVVGCRGPAAALEAR